jgi:two-component system sensor histidine kinase MprB
MTFRRRMILLAAAAVAIAVVLVSVVVYISTREELLGQIDANLRQKLTPGEEQSVRIRIPAVSGARLAKLVREGKRPPVETLSLTRIGKAPLPHVARARGEALSGSTKARAKQVVGGFSSAAAPAGGGQVAVAGQAAAGGKSVGMAKLVLPPDGGIGGEAGYVQWIQSDGHVLHSPAKGALLPVTAATRAVAAGTRDAFYSDATVAGSRVRVLTEKAPGDGVWQVALPLGGVEGTLSHLRLILALVGLGGIALAAGLGWLVSRGALVPVRRLTGAAERVGRTHDLGHRIEVEGDDELARLADSFNSMLAALERSQAAQRRLVSDASHELRTPLTSIGANLDALAIGERLDPAERARVVAAARAQLAELAVLVGDLVDLSKTEVEEIEVEDVRLDLAAAGAIERARLHAPGCRFELDAEPCLVRAAPARLERAIANLLDNAVKWGPRSGPVEVEVRDGRLQVRDRGPGIDPEDLPHVFDRFYRAPAARSRPGSGLGLAIVRQFAESHGGSVEAADEPGGGARLRLELAPLAMSAAEAEAARSGAGVR